MKKNQLSNLIEFDATPVESKIVYQEMSMHSAIEPSIEMAK